MTLKTKAKAMELCNIVHHSSMGDNWIHFVKSRAKKIVDQITQNGILLGEEESTVVHCEPEQTHKFWEEVKIEIDKI